MLRRIPAFAALFGLALAAASPAQATIALNLQSGSYVGIGGGGAGPGGIGGTTYIGTPIGSPPNIVTIANQSAGSFTVSAIGTSFTNPAGLDLASLAISSTAGGTLYMTLTDSGFTTPTGLASFATVASLLSGNFLIGGGTVEAKVWANSSNIPFATTGNLMTDILITSTGGTFGASQSISSPPRLASPYSLTLQLILTTTGPARLSSDASTTVTHSPEPGTMAAALAGFPLLAYAGLRSKRRRKA